mgnify:CR=1 FL=1
MVQKYNALQVPQDLHIHTVFSEHDSAVVPEQTPELIAKVNHARIIGISDHFEHFDYRFDEYQQVLKKWGFHIGTEVDGSEYVDQAAGMDFEYYIYHCRDDAREYRGIETLLATGKPVIIPHPMALDTDLKKVPEACFIEINNRYVWRDDWRRKIGPFAKHFRFVIGSDAHQPIWLNQNVARYVAGQLGIEETLVFDH